MNFITKFIFQEKYFIKFLQKGQSFLENRPQGKVKKGQNSSQ